MANDRQTKVGVRTYHNKFGFLKSQAGALAEGIEFISKCIEPYEKRVGRCLQLAVERKLYKGICHKRHIK